MSKLEENCDCNDDCPCKGEPATQEDIHKFFDSGTGAITSEQLSDPYPDANDAAYWSMTYNATYDSSNAGECYNVRGNGNLRGAPKRVLNNPYASDLRPKVSGIIINGISFQQT